MDAKIKVLLEREKIDKPILSMRQVGNRIELHLLGDYQPVVYDLEAQASVPAEPARDAVTRAQLAYTSAELSSLTVPALQGIAAGLGLATRKRKKSELVAQILEVQDHDDLIE